MPCSCSAHAIRAELPKNLITLVSDMLKKLTSSFLRMKPAVLIGIVLLLEAVAFTTVLPAIQSAMAPNYGISFTDNYQLLGQHLAAGEGFRFTLDTSLTLMREPGYPFFLAGLFTVFGYSLTAARMANLLFAFGSALLVSHLARKVSGSELAARVAPLLFLVHPGVILSEARGGVECLFILLLMLFFWKLLQALDSARMKDYLLAGLLLGLSATVRSTALLFPGFLLIYFVFFERVRPSLVTMASRVAVMMLAAFLVLSPWIVRNYKLVHEFVPTASVMGVSAYSGYHICTNLTFRNTLHDVDAAAGDARAALARQQGYKFKEMDNLYYLYFFSPKDEITFNEYLAKTVMGHYRESPGLFISCVSKNLFHFWFSGRNWTVTAINVVIQLPYLVLGILGMIWGWRSENRPAFATFVLFIVYTMAVYLPILAQVRYSMHLIPLLCICAAIPVAGFWRKRAALASA